MEPSLPSANSGNNLWRYIRETHKFPLLSAEVEQMLCHPWRDHHDISAAHQLARSHLRLVVKIAMRYRGYGLPAEELIGEGHVGLMRAVCRFDPDRGIRFSTYAIWWVRAAIQEYILHNCSLVKMGTTAAQKKLFFNLRRMRDHSREFDKGTLRPEHAAGIANVLRVPAHEVITMSQRMAGPDRSLNAPPGADGESEWQSWLVDDSDSQETELAEREETAQQKALLPSAWSELTMRERHIVVERWLRERPTTLADLSQHYGVSRERIRRIEARAMIKLRRWVCSRAGPVVPAGATQAKIGLVTSPPGKRQAALPSLERS
jgi:RNA polymerase sigma-32 factor